MAISPLIVNPKLTHLEASSVAAGATHYFQGDSIPYRNIGHLLKVVCSSSVPWKAELQVVIDNLPSDNKIVWFSSNPEMDLHKGMLTCSVDQNYSGLSYFRVIMTNLDPARSADMYISIFWDEVELPIYDTDVC